MEDSFRLGVQIFKSQFKPTFIVGLWRGGSTVGIYVQECLQTLGIETNHISIRTSYEGLSAYAQSLNDPKRSIRVHGTQYLIEELSTDDHLLIVDDVYSTGRNVEAVIDRLDKRLKRNMPQNVKVAALWYRPEARQTGRVPDFYQHETSDWLVLPYELTGLTDTELKAHKPLAFDLLQGADAKNGHDQS